MKFHLAGLILILIDKIILLNLWFIQWENFIPPYFTLSSLESRSLFDFLWLDDIGGKFQGLFSKESHPVLLMFWWVQLQVEHLVKDISKFEISLAIIILSLFWF